MGRFINLTGQRFGQLTVIEKDDILSKEKRRIYWKCQCQCGRIKSIRGDGLKSIQTCGDCIYDLTGQRFGRLVVIKKGKKDNAQHQFWQCKCDCGNIVEINGDNLRREVTKSCGCLHSEIMHNTVFIDLTGQRFGKLIPIKYFTEQGKTYWQCQCDCGNITTVARNNLVNGHTSSCGCITSSVGEYNIDQLLKSNNITYHKEYVFPDLPKLRFDFYLPEINRAIEFDGIQHFTYISSWHQTPEEFQKARQRDEIKNQYCTDKKIELVRIPYTERDKITLEMLLGKQYLIKTKDIEEVQEVIENE